jgi:uncharacterized membrane protein
MSTEPDARQGPGDADTPPGPERLLALSDGVVAIALTLLVLDLKVPTLEMVHSARSPSDLLTAMGHDTDQLISYLVSFYVVAQFWLAHHRIFRSVTGHSEGLAWWNFGFLFAITLIPFTSGLLGEFAENPLAVDIFAGNMLLASLTTQATARYVRHRGLVSDSYSLEQHRAGQIRSITVAGIMLTSIAVAWVSPDDAKYIWIAIAFLPDFIIRATRPSSANGRDGRHHAGRS